MKVPPKDRSTEIAIVIKSSGARTARAIGQALPWALCPLANLNLMHEA